MLGGRSVCPWGVKYCKPVGGSVDFGSVCLWGGGGGGTVSLRGHLYMSLDCVGSYFRIWWRARDSQLQNCSSLECESCVTYKLN